MICLCTLLPKFRDPKRKKGYPPNDSKKTDVPRSSFVKVPERHDSKFHSFTSWLHKEHFAVDTNYPISEKNSIYSNGSSGNDDGCS